MLYCVPKRSTFIDRDIAGLSANFKVRTHELLAEPSWLLPLRLLHQLSWLIGNRAWRHDCICHFSGYHALLPTLICRRTFIILAGSDCASIPSIGYGNHARRSLGWATRLAASRATRLLPVHESLMFRHQSYAGDVPREQGIAAFANVSDIPWTTVPYGFDPSYWDTSPRSPHRDPNSFICVPGPSAPGNRLHWLKGVDLVLEIARRIPTARFQVVGLADTKVYRDAPENVEFIGRVKPEKLKEIYSSTSFHLQLSLSEGMPNALCEAMLCGCIPLVSDVSSMPDIVKGCGAVLERKDQDEAVKMCSALLDLDRDQRIERSLAARERIRTLYPMQRRIQALSELLRLEVTGA